LYFGICHGGDVKLIDLRTGFFVKTEEIKVFDLEDVTERMTLTDQYVPPLDLPWRGETIADPFDKLSHIPSEEFKESPSSVIDRFMADNYIPEIGDRFFIVGTPQLEYMCVGTGNDFIEAIKDGNSFASMPQKFMLADKYQFMPIDESDDFWLPEVECKFYVHKDDPTTQNVTIGKVFTCTGKDEEKGLVYGYYKEGEERQQFVFSEDEYTFSEHKEAPLEE
jgi:hypothetical protein